MSDVSAMLVATTHFLTLSGISWLEGQRAAGNIWEGWLGEGYLLDQTDDLEREKRERL